MLASHPGSTAKGWPTDSEAICYRSAEILQPCRLCSIIPLWNVCKPFCVNPRSRNSPQTSDSFPVRHATRNNRECLCTRIMLRFAWISFLPLVSLPSSWVSYKRTTQAQIVLRSRQEKASMLGKMCESSYFTSQSLTLDGGLTAQRPHWHGSVTKHPAEPREEQPIGQDRIACSDPQAEAIAR